MTREGVPIRITREVENTLREGARAARERGTETCFLLFAQDGVIMGADRVGQPLEHAAMTRPDFTAGDALVRERREDGFAHVGQAHVHLGYGSASSGDIQTLRDVAQRGLAGYVCIVANITSDGRVTLTAHTVDAEGSVYEHTIDVVEQRPEYEPLIPTTRRDIAYLQLGIGSGGSEVAQQAARWGVRQLTFIDHDRLEARNAQRHHATIAEAEKHIKKTTWVRRHLKHRTTSRIVTHARQLSPNDRDWLRERIAEHDVIGECTGHPVVREIVSEECWALGKPLVTAGVFERAKGGYVFVQHGSSDAACNRCLFKLNRHTARDDHETIEQLTRDYGFTPEQLERQLGLFTDIGLTAILQAKVLLDLIRGIEHDANLYLIDNQALSLRKAFVKQSSTCSLCHPNTAR